MKENNNDSEKNKVKKKNNLKLLKKLIIKIIIIVLMAYIIFKVLFAVRRMDDQSMNPSITEGNLLLFYRLDKKYNVGDIILFEHNGKEYVLRIVAKEGQKVDINEKNELLINGHKENLQTYYETAKQQDSSIEYPYLVENGKVFVMGDYRLSKDDSRIFGAISINQIKGKIIGRLQSRNF